jgi:ABC-type transporter Mla MlaB component
MKQEKRKKSAAAPEQSADAGMTAGKPLLPDADYVEQLLAASAPVAADSAVAVKAIAVSQEVAVVSVQSRCDPLSLPAQCLLRDAVEYRQHLLHYLPEKTMTVDAAAVERIDTAFMQVLLAFVRSRPGDSEPVAWLNVNPVLVEAARLLGVQQTLSLPDAA